MYLHRIYTAGLELNLRTRSISVKRSSGPQVHLLQIESDLPSKTTYQQIRCGNTCKKLGRCKYCIKVVSFLNVKIISGLQLVPYGWQVSKPSTSSPACPFKVPSPTLRVQEAWPIQDVPTSAEETLSEY